jgi:hypothetical protein
MIANATCKGNNITALDNMRHETYQYRLTLDMYVMQLTSIIRHKAKCTSSNLPVPSDTWHVRHATYQYLQTLDNLYVMQLTSTVWYLTKSRHETYQYLLTLDNMYVMQLTSTVW